MTAAAITRILVPVDFSPCSRSALDYAAQLADQTSAVLDIVYVYEPSGYVGPDTLVMLPEATRSQAWDQTRADVMRELDGFLGAMRPRVRNLRVEPGIPGDVIAAVAKHGDYDLIVMGTHGRSGFTRLVVGSVAESVMRKAQVPVLTLRMPRREQRERVPL